MDLLDRITVEVTTQDGLKIPTFVFHTSMFDQASLLLRLLRLWPLPINLALLKTLSPASAAQLFPDNGLRIEWAFEDRDPNHAYEAYVPYKMLDPLIQANLESRSLRIALKRSHGKPSQSEFILNDYSPFILDWFGVLGISVLIRQTWSHPIPTNKIDALLVMLHQRLETNGPATGLYTELGYLYRLKEEWKQSIDCYIREIRLGLRPDGTPGLGCMKALCNLGVVYKKLHDLDRARNCFILALHLNPNYFEALLSLSGIVQDTDTALQCLSRGYRLRPQDPNIVPAIHILCESRSLPLETTARRIEQLAAEMDVTRPLPQFTIDDPRPYLRHLGLENEIQV